MQAIFDFIVIPKEQEKSELILNTELQIICL